jgi:diguanylate cyclase
VSAYRFALPGWRRNDIGWVVAAGCAGTVVMATALLFFGPAVRYVVVPAANLAMVWLLAATMLKMARLPQLARPAARFWRTQGWGMLCYAAGIGLDVIGVLAHAIFGLPDIQIGELVFPLAGMVVLVAMFQYPTTARTRGERITVVLDVTIVLIAAAAFLWYFVVSRAWVPADGPITFFRALVVPVITLVTGFAILKIAFVGAGVIARVPMIWFAFSATLGAVGSGLEQGSFAQVVLMGSQVAGLAGLVAQYRISAGKPQTGRRSGRRKAFSVLPYGASLGAFLFLVVVLKPVIHWREVGVVTGAGLLLCAVTARQVYALRENARLLTSNRELTEQLQHQAWYDELTGLANRALFAVRVREAMSRPGHEQHRTAIFLIDLDDFKTVNDTMGHAAGDELLQQVARRLQAQVRGTDTVCRLGGDEFVIIATDIDPVAADWLAGRVVAAVAKPVELATGTVRVGASVGVAFGDATNWAGRSAGHGGVVGRQPGGRGREASSEPAGSTNWAGRGREASSEPACSNRSDDADARTDVGDILRRADVAMYAAKSAGKGSWRVYETLPPPPSPRQPAAA